GWRKINNANAFGEVAKEGYGPEFTRKTISDLFQIPIQYYARVDFKAFEELIDRIGGVHVCVDNSFTDYTYPTYDEKYQTLSFKAGCQDMNGDYALKFVRSRHSLMNNEGSDFARSKRQQKVLTAVKEKVFSASTLLNPGKITDLLQTYQEHVATNLKPWEIVKLAHVSRKLDDTHIKNIVFDDGVGGYLVAGITEGAYVLQPRDGTYDAMRQKIQGIFEETTIDPSPILKAPAPERQAITKPQVELTTVSVLNGTAREGLATRGATFLRNKGYAIKSVGNAPTRDTIQTVLIDNTNGVKKQELSSLQSLFNAKIETGGMENFDTTADFTLILGNEATQ
ncbi:MAG: LCP family protein, partial [bacterium]|nr:LCP family protein [bacterium]